MAERHRQRILTIPPGLPFLRTLAKALCDGSLVESFRYDPADPLALSRVTIFLPTRRAARVLRSEFVDLLGGRSAILPVIRPLGETDDDTGFFDETVPDRLDLDPPIPGTARLLELARLILSWRNRLPEVIRDIHSDSPLVAPASPADAIWLARDLAELIDSVETEERDWDDLKKLNAEDYAHWWQLTLEFLKIASAFWPARLQELSLSSPARHRNAILRGEAERLAKARHEGPVIVAGSTGSLPATAELIATVAGLPEGAVVLPGLDTSMDEDIWRGLTPSADDPRFQDPTLRGHPQYGLALLLSRLGTARSEVAALAKAEEPLSLRQRLISQAMTPASATDRWANWQADIDAKQTVSAFADVSLIEAQNEREEATAIAIALRLALEEPGVHGESQAALITPDRTLARRVVSELARFGITADDSAGTPLSQTPQGTLLRLVLETTLRPGDPVAIASLLKHPLLRLQMPSGRLALAVRALEAIALRGGLGECDIALLGPLLARQLEEQKADRHRPQWRRSIARQAIEDAAIVAEKLAEAVEPLASAFLRRGRERGLSDRFTLSAWAERTGSVLENLCRDEAGDLAALWTGEAGQALASLLGEVIEAQGQLDASGPQWIDIADALTAGSSVKPQAMSHPRVFIFGTLEARLQSVDTLVLGGLNEGSWPAESSNNPFLSRTMKTGMGLEPPERRLGQHAHDFEMANGTRKLIYSRSARQGSAPTVPSRWLQRLKALLGPEIIKDMRERGDRFRDWAGAIDTGEKQTLARRPEPRPPADMQPVRYSFSEVSRLRRDPYSIYARRILRLDPVDPFNADPGAAERGTLYHAIIDAFTKSGAKAGTDEAERVMEALIAEHFDREELPPHIDAVWRPRFREVAHAFLKWEAGRQTEIGRTVTEVGAAMQYAPAGITITGIADRIDIKGPGHADINDYKTGSNPSPSQARALLDPQLALEAAALRAGAFKDVEPLTAENLLYVRLRPGDRFDVQQVNNELSARDPAKAKSADQLADEALHQLGNFVSVLRTGERGFVSRLLPFSQNDYGGEYDHLARVAEWSTADGQGEDGDE
jgi:ATP-dependent helicase/nuclease subunit B